MLVEEVGAKQLNAKVMEQDYEFVTFPKAEAPQPLARDRDYGGGVYGDIRARLQNEGRPFRSNLRRRGQDPTQTSTQHSTLQEGAQGFAGSGSDPPVKRRIEPINSCSAQTPAQRNPIPLNQMIPGPTGGGQYNPYRFWRSFFKRRKGRKVYLC